jgi:hypothetical protein
MNNVARQEEIRQLVTICKPDIVCLRETKLSVINSNIIRSSLGFRYEANFAFLSTDGTKALQSEPACIGIGI